MVSNPPKLKVYDNFKSKDEQLLFLEAAQSMKQPMDLLSKLSIKKPQGGVISDFQSHTFRATCTQRQRPTTPMKNTGFLTPSKNINRSITPLSTRCKSALRSTFKKEIKTDTTLQGKQYKSRVQKYKVQVSLMQKKLEDATERQGQGKQHSGKQQMQIIEVEHLKNSVKVFQNIYETSVDTYLKFNAIEKHKVMSKDFEETSVLTLKQRVDKLNKVKKTYEITKKELECDQVYNNRLLMIVEQKKLLEEKQRQNAVLKESVLKHTSQIAMVFQDIQQFNGCLMNKLTSINEEKREMGAKLQEG